MNVNFSHTAFRSPAIKLLTAIVIAFSGSRCVFCFYSRCHILWPMPAHGHLPVVEGNGVIFSLEAGAEALNRLVTAHLY